MCSNILFCLAIESATVDFANMRMQHISPVQGVGLRLSDLLSLPPREIAQKRRVAPTPKVLKDTTHVYLLLADAWTTECMWHAGQ